MPPLDANDVLRAHGASALRSAFDVGSERMNGTHNVAEDHRSKELKLAAICAGKLLQKPAPLRRWLVPGWLPKDEVTLFAGDGGIGKSTLAIQLAVAAATGSRWIGLEVEKMRVGILSAEDGCDELHYRSEKIVAGETTRGREDTLRDLENVWFFDATTDIDPSLATYDDKSGIIPTVLYQDLKSFVEQNKIGLLIIDSAADVFAEEIKRHAVRSFIRLLKSIGCTVVLIAHPSVDGMKSGRGYGGSTHWNNSVRSRVYFTREAPGEPEADRDLRLLELPKANRAQAGQKLWLRWTEHGFVPENSRAVGDVRCQVQAEQKFLYLLGLFNKQGQKVGSNPGKNYAPTRFAEHPEAERISSKAFSHAMQILLSAEKVRLVMTEEAPSRRKQVLVINEALSQ